MEIAIVLGVAGFVFAGVWVVASSVAKNNNIQRVQREILEVSQNIREQYVGTFTPATWSSALPSLNVTLDARNVFPAEMRVYPTLAPGDSTQVINSPLSTATNGSFRVYYAYYGSPSSISPAPPAICGSVACFRIGVYSLSGDVCAKLVRSLPIDDTQMGIVQLGVANSTGSCTGTTCVGATLPSVSGAVGWCNGTSTDNSVFWDFKLHN